MPYKLSNLVTPGQRIQQFGQWYVITEVLSKGVNARAAGKGKKEIKFFEFGCNITAWRFS